MTRTATALVLLVVGCGKVVDDPADVGADVASAEGDVAPDCDPFGVGVNANLPCAKEGIRCTYACGASVVVTDVSFTAVCTAGRWRFEEPVGLCPERF